MELLPEQAEASGMPLGKESTEAAAMPLVTETTEAAAMPLAWDLARRPERVVTKGEQMESAELREAQASA
jgi:hypothetical protein